MRPAGVPEQLWLSDFPVRRPGGNHHTKGKMPWTDRLLHRAHVMHENGDPWNEVARMLYEETGVRMSDGGVADYVDRHYGDRA